MIRKYFIHFILGISVAVVISIPLLRSVDRGFNHDEHQFIVPSVLIARDGLLPYLNYALFHQPYGVLLNAFLIKCGGWPLLTARLVSGIASGGTLAALFLLACFRLHEHPLRTRLLGAWTGVFLVFGSPVFLHTSGRSWNHDLPTFLALVAAFLASNGRADSGWFRFLMIGALGGLTVGLRLTFAPFALLLGLSPWLLPNISVRIKWNQIFLISLGTVATLLPSIWFYGQAPDRYLFGNFQYPAVSYLDEVRGAIPDPMLPLEKLIYFLRKIALPDAAFFLALAVTIPAVIRNWKDRDNRGGIIFLALAASLLIGAVAPARLHEQYFYSPMILALGASLWTLPHLGNRKRCFLAGLAAVGFFFQVPNLLDWKDCFSFKNWTVNKVHQSAIKMRGIVPAGCILTLSPTLAVEAGLKVYPELALGPFGWRCAELFPEARQRELMLIGPDDLELLIEKNAPQAILTDVKEPDIEIPLVEYARSHGYQPQTFERRLVLWLPANDTAKPAK